MVEPTKGSQRLVQPGLPGMAEGRVAQIMRERQRLGQILIQPQMPCDAARDLRDLQAVREAGAVEVALMCDEDLRFVLQLAESRAVDDAVAVALIGAAIVRLGGAEPAQRSRLPRAQARQ